MLKLVIFMRRIRFISKTEGLRSLFRHSLIFVRQQFYEREWYLLYERTTKNILRVNERDLKPRFVNFTVEIIKTTSRADELESQGFYLRHQARNFDERLSKGAIAFCIFVGKDLVNIGWIALSDEAKLSLWQPPFRVNFNNAESVTGGAWTDPRYRNTGLMSYSLFKRLEFLHNMGIVRDRAAVPKQNIASVIGSKKFDSNIYAEGLYFRIFKLRFWREQPMR